MSEYWANEGKELFREYLKLSAEEISKMIKLDFFDTRSATEIGKNKDKKIYKEGWELVSETDGRIIIRDVKGFSKGRVCSIEKTMEFTRCPW